MITSEKVRKMVRTLEEMLPYAADEDSLNMHEPAVCSDHVECGTAHCVGGWYLLAKKWDGNTRHDPSLEDEDWDSGADLMARDLGIDSRYDLESWAYENDIVWGNTRGLDMFREHFAYTPGGKEYAKSLREVCDHWLEVADRLDERTPWYRRWLVWK